ncbi:MAG: putative porin [Bacteroidaceae bacterium]|nr:putative porin [Bacteroidaceae bacterium]
MKQTLRYILLIILYMCFTELSAQMTLGGRSSDDIFNPNREDDHFSANDSIETTDVPFGFYVWNIDARFGEVKPAIPDTVTHLFYNEWDTSGKTGGYNFTGNLGSPRIARYYFDRKNGSMQETEFLFARPFDFFLKTPAKQLFTNTKSPFTNLTYHECGDKQNGEDTFRAMFATNAGKKLGLGFNLDYLYGRGYYMNQATSSFAGILYASYIDERYKAHAYFNSSYLKITENGGLEDDAYITQPESFPTAYSPADMPTKLSKTWNKLHLNTFYLTHNLSLGYTQYRNSKGEIVKRKKAHENATEQTSAQQADSILGSKLNAEFSRTDTIDSLSSLDSLTTLRGNMAAKTKAKADTILTPEFVAVAKVIHTLQYDFNSRLLQSNAGASATKPLYYADYFLPTDSIEDMFQYTSVKNTLALEMNEGFRKWVKTGMRIFASHEFQHFTMPGKVVDSKDKYYRNFISVGAQLMKNQGHYLHYNVLGEMRTDGKKWGEFCVEGNADFNLPVRKDTIQLAVNARIANEQPAFLFTRFHGRSAWWDIDNLSNVFSTTIGATLSYKKTMLFFKMATIQNYIDFMHNAKADGNNSLGNPKYLYGVGVYQANKNVQVITAGIDQRLKWGILNWNTRLTMQLTSDNEIIPLPKLDIYTNLYIDFRIARVLNTQIGADMRYFTAYEAPDYSPIVGQYVLQDTSVRQKVGNYPIVNAYINFHLKHTRFYVMMSHVNHSAGSGSPFLVPHYPLNERVLRLGISWNFFN